ncbi:MAG: hypothetical protein HY553_06960 [Elusimicrobia bacterium]|nr:hypothetical protein [Elusimicrobiota bacterium]
MLGYALCALLALAPAARAADEAEGPIRVVSTKPLKVPWNTTRSSWEETKEIADSHWRAIPFAQIAAAVFLVKTGLAAPFDLVAAPFRQQSRHEVPFDIGGRLVDADGTALSKAKLVVRCTTPLEVSKRGYDSAYYESERYGPLETDEQGGFKLSAVGLTGASKKFMVHVDVEDGPKGSGSAGGYTVSLSSARPAVTLDVPGAFRLVH